jgi:hypothetical protein
LTNDIDAGFDKNEKIKNSLKGDSSILWESMASKSINDAGIKKKRQAKKLLTHRLRKRSVRRKYSAPPIEVLVQSLRQAAKTVKGFGR